MRIASLFTVALLLGATAARAQVQPPPYSEAAPPISKPPTTDTTPTFGPTTAPAPPPPYAQPAPPPPPTPLPPALAPEPAPAAPLTLEMRQTPPPPRPTPFYQKVWFWSAVGVVVVSAVIITLASRGPSGPDTPATTLGDMHAF